MKKISIILFLFSAILTSCEPERVIYDNVSGQSYLKFEETLVDLPVPRTGEETISIPISVSTISTSERRVSVSIVEEETSLDAANYSFSEAVIPANSYIGTLEVTGTNADLAIGEVETVTFQIEDLSVGDFNASPETVTVRAFLSCPYDPLEFVGTYLATREGTEDYEVTVTYDEDTELFRIENLYDTGGETYVEFDYTNSVASVNFRPDLSEERGVLYVHSTYGNIYAVNPSVSSGNTSDDISTFRTCDNFIDLFFRRQLQDGRFFTGTTQVSLTKIE